MRTTNASKPFRLPVAAPRGEKPAGGVRSRSAVVDAFEVRGAGKVSTPSTLAAAVPQFLLDAYAPKVARLGRDLGALTPEERSKLAAKSTEVAKFFAGNAYKRVFEEARFAEEYASFSYADVSHLSATDTRSLGAFLEDERKLTLRVASTDRGEALAKAVDERIDAVLRKGGTPVIMTDLDDTLYSYTSRLENALHAYDKANGTKHFAGLVAGKGPNAHTEDWLYGYLGGTIADTRALITLVDAVKRFVAGHAIGVDAPRNDRLNTALRDRFKAWVAKGAVVLPLTARFASQAKATADALERDGLSRESIYVGALKGTTAANKTASANTWLAEHPGAELVGYFDDDLDNVEAIRKGVAEALAIRVYWTDGPMILTDGSAEAHYRAIQSSR